MGQCCQRGDQHSTTRRHISYQGTVSCTQLLSPLNCLCVYVLYFACIRPCLPSLCLLFSLCVHHFLCVFLSHCSYFILAPLLLLPPLLILLVPSSHPIVIIITIIITTTTTNTPLFPPFLPLEWLSQGHPGWQCCQQRKEAD